MNDIAFLNADIQIGLLETISDALSAGLLVYDRDDMIIFGSSRVATLLNISEIYLNPQSQLRDIFAQYYDIRVLTEPDFLKQIKHLSRADWVSENLAAHWKERSETVVKLPKDRWLRFSRRRLPSGLGVTLISDISEQKKSEFQWRADIDRVQVIEELLDSLPYPVFVYDDADVYVGINEAACVFMNCTADVLVGRTVHESHTSEVAARIAATNKKVISSGEASIVPERVTRVNGDEKLYMTRKQRIDKSGKNFVLTTMQDVTPFSVLGDDGRLHLASMEYLDFVNSPQKQNGKHSARPAISGQKILIATTHHTKANEILELLKRQGADCAYVDSTAELAAFSSQIKLENMMLDLILIGDDIPISVGEYARLVSHSCQKVSFSKLDVEQIMEMAISNFHEDISINNTEIITYNTSTSVDGFYQATFNKELDVLVVEDNKVNQLVFSQILDLYSMNYVIVKSAEEAFDVLDRVAPLLILLDTTLPDLDGFATAKRIRTHSKDSVKACPIIGVVPQAFSGDSEACESAGMNGMLLKPLSPDMLDTYIQQFVPHKYKQNENKIYKF